MFRIQGFKVEGLVLGPGKTNARRKGVQNRKRTPESESKTCLHYNVFVPVFLLLNLVGS